ncbi:hypothetical protein RBB50_010783 [Rhinocladiella similis]
MTLTTRSPSPGTHGFGRDTSIVLLGAPGTGKSSLAILASTRLRFRHVEVNEVFLETTGLSRAAYRKQHGPTASREQQLAVLREILTGCSRNCIIVFPGDYVEENGLLLLKTFNQDHPVIHLRRSLAAIQQYLKPLEATKTERLVEYTDRIYRSCSNFEFYNLDEPGQANTMATDNSRISRPGSDLVLQRPWPLRLKHMEESFARFLSNIFSQPNTSEQHQGRICIPKSRAVYTYMLCLTVDQILSPNFDVEYLDCGVEACQLAVPWPSESELSDLTPRLEQITRAFATLQRHFDGILIYHVQLPFSTSSSLPQWYTALIEHGIRLAADYCTVHLGQKPSTYSGLFNPPRRVSIIGDYHDENPGADGWGTQKRWELYRMAQESGFDGVRLSQRALSADDNARATAFTVQAGRVGGKRPFLIAYNTGSLGRHSRCFNQVLTPVTTMALSNGFDECSQMRSTDHVITIQQSQKALYSAFIYDAMNYFIIGVDVSYSLSPVVHNASHQFFGMPHRLLKRSLSSLDELPELFQDANFGGLSIAQGYKMSILPRLTVVSDHAQRIGAVNTVIPIRAAWDYDQRPPPAFWESRNRSGPIHGFYGDNIDWVGMRQCVLENLSPANVITDRTVALVIGAGGMARAAVYALMQMDVHHIVLYNRTYSRAVELAQYFGGVSLPEVTGQLGRLSPESNQAASVTNRNFQRFRVLQSLNSEWFSELLQPTIIISCIPSSRMAGEPCPNFSLPESWMRSQTGGVILDLNYRPLITPLLRQALQHSEKGWVAVDGLENLAAQASAQFDLFTCRKLPKRFMRIEALKAYLETHKDDEEVCQIIQRQLTRLQARE